MTTEPVADWAEDFEIFDDEFVKDPYPVWKDLRDQGCPFARTERRQVTYMPTTFEATRQVAGDTDSFSSYSVSVTQRRSPMTTTAIVCGRSSVLTSRTTRRSAA